MTTTPTPLTVNSARRGLTAQFEQAGLGDCEAEARDLVMAAAGLTRAQLVTQAHEPMSPQAETCLKAYGARRIAGEPVDNILGWREFYGRRFEISKDVLSPRQETEEVTAKALSMIKDVPSPRILDLGTGSGAIITTLLCERIDARGTAADISQAALEIARRNAATHKVMDRLALIKSDWFAAVPKNEFDLIISNPPYIDSAAMEGLETEVKDYDPALALHGGEDGLEPYRRIAARAREFMRPGAALVLEIGYDQGERVPEILRQAGFANVSCANDLFGLPRIVTATYAAPPPSRLPQKKAEKKL